MLVNQTHTQNFGAVSAVDVNGGTGQPVVIMNASINQNGAISFNQQIQNPTLYEANKEEADADIEAFRTEVLNSVQ